MRSSYALSLILTFSMTLLSACATQSADQRAEGAPVCTREYPLGSALPRTVCVTPEAAAEAKRLNGLDRVGNPNIVKPPKAGAGG